MREGGLGSSDTASGEKQKEIFNDTRTDTVENTDPKTQNEGSEASCKIFYFIDSYWKYFFQKRTYLCFKIRKKK